MASRVSSNKSSGGGDPGTGKSGVTNLTEQCPDNPTFPQGPAYAGDWQEYNQSDAQLSLGAYTGARAKLSASTVPPPTAPLAEQPLPDRTGNLRVGGECGAATACATGFMPPSSGRNGVNDRFLCG